MDFSLTEEQLMFQKMVADFATKEIAPHAAHYDEAEEFPAENVRKMADLGLFGVTISEEYGGCGGDSITTAIATEEIAKACAGTSAVYLATLSLASHPINNAGTHEQKKKFLTPLAQGKKLAAFALTEPAAGSDATALETTAQRQGTNYVLNGTKVFITNGAEADIFSVFATENKSLKHRGIVALVVEKGTKGFSVVKKEIKMGIRASSTAQLAFDNCVVPLENRLGADGQGFHIAMEAIDSSRVSVAAQALGIAQACLDASLRYAKERQQFGKPIVEHQAIQWMLADMATAVDAARLLTYRAAWLKDQKKPFLKEAAMAKLYASEVAMHSAIKAVQIHGGYGFIKDFPVERYMRDAKITEIYEGTSEMQRMTIARQLIKG